MSNLIEEIFYGVIVLAVIGFYFYFILGFGNPISTDSNTIIENGTLTTENEDYNFYDSPREIKLSYVVNGESWTLTTIEYGGLNSYLEKLPRSISYYSDYESPPTKYDYIMRNLDEPNQKKILDNLVKFIQDSNKSELEKVKMVVSLVQNIPYDYKAADYDIDIGKYPYEVLYKNMGVCGEKSELLIYLLRGLGYGTAYFSFEKENHAAVGIKCPEEYDYLDTNYCFIESTTPNIITDSYGDYRNAGKLTSTPEVIVISNGKTYLGAEEDYKATQRYIQLNEDHESKAKYSEWIQIRKKYGLEEKECSGESILCNGVCHTPCKPGYGFYCYADGPVCKR